jgi:ribose 5-phosphate isomerase B
MVDEAAARSSREHNDANVAAFSALKTGEDEAKRLLEIWLGTEFAGGRHQRRVDQIAGIEKKTTGK